MRTSIFSVLLIASLLPATAALAQPKLSASLSTAEVDGAQVSELNFTESDCEEECHVATLVCEQSTAISIVLADVSSKHAGQAINREKTQIVLSAGKASFDYFIYKMEFMELTGSWWLTAREQGSEPLAIAKAIASAKAIELRTAGKHVTLPVDNTVKDWALACK